MFPKNMLQWNLENRLYWLYFIEFTIWSTSEVLYSSYFRLQSSNNYSTASVNLYFKRRVVYHLLNIFLQSFLLVITGYMSLFFQVNNFSDRVMVALTVMLVMASLQSSIQDSLPKTAYFKFIDWWILVSLNTQVGDFWICNTDCKMSNVLIILVPKGKKSPNSVSKICLDRWH